MGDTLKRELQRELRGEDQPALELPRVCPGHGELTESSKTKDEAFEDVVKSAQEAAV
jgi:hypothetical protein